MVEAVLQQMRSHLLAQVFSVFLELNEIDPFFYTSLSLNIVKTGEIIRENSFCLLGKVLD